MARVAVVGGHGKIALHLHPILMRDGHIPVALVRTEAYRAELEALGAEVRLLDIEKSTAAGFATSFAGCEMVVFSAGAGADGNVERKRTVDLEGSLKSIEGALQTGINRFVQVSSIGVDDPIAADASPAWRAYVETKRAADEALRASQLDWTILRPGPLTDSSGTGRIALGSDLPRREIARVDVAATIAAVLELDETIGRQWVLVEGDLLIDEAIAAITSSAGRS